MELGEFKIMYDVMDYTGKSFERCISHPIEVDGVDIQQMLNSDLSGRYEGIPNPIKLNYGMYSELLEKYKIPSLMRLLVKDAYIEFPNGWKLVMMWEGTSKSDWWSPGKNGFVW